MRDVRGDGDRPIRMDFVDQPVEMRIRRRQGKARRKIRRAVAPDLLGPGQAMAMVIVAAYPVVVSPVSDSISVLVPSLKTLSAEKLATDVFWPLV